MDDVAPLSPNDARVAQHTTTLSTGRTYHYLVLPPPAEVPLRGTIVLVHGFPDLPMGWRYVAPRIAQLGVRVVMPAMLGYSRTDSPADAKEYTFRSIAADLAALARHVVATEDVGGEKTTTTTTTTTTAKPPTELPVLLGGHDWGGATVWTTARLYPDVFSSVFSVCVPCVPPSTTFVTLDMMAAVYPTFGYMRQLGSVEFAAKVHKSERTVRNFLAGLYTYGRFDPLTGIDEAEVVDEDGPPPRTAEMMDEEMLNHYVREFTRNGTAGHFNYYRNRKANYEADLAEASAEGGPLKIRIPSLFAVALSDGFVTRDVAEANMERESRFEEGVPFEVQWLQTGHWAMLGESAASTSAVLCDWVEKSLERAKQEGKNEKGNKAAAEAVL